MPQQLKGAVMPKNTGETRQTLPMQMRGASIVPASVNEAERTFDVTWTTGARVTRYSWSRDEEYDEELVVTPQAVRLERLNQGAAFLDSHQQYSLASVLGVVVPGSARIKNGKGTATIKLSDRDDVEPVWRDVRAGILRHVSVGYQVHRFARVEAADRKDGGTRTLMQAVDWEPFEVSAVAIPADPGAQIRGTEAGLTPVVIENRSHTMLDDENPQPGGGNPAPQNTRDTAAIRALCARHGFNDLADAAITRGDSLEQVRALVLDRMAQNDPLQGRTFEPETRIGNSWDGPTGTRAKLIDGFTARLDRGHKPTIGADFAGRSMGELCVELCRMRGERPSSQRDAIQMCSGRNMHTTSDFALITANSMSNVVARQFAQNIPAIARASREVPRIDYHAGKALTLSASGMPKEIKEGGEIEFVTMDEKGENLPAPRNFGSGFNLSIEAITNDRFDLLAQAGERMQRGATERMRAVLLEPLEANSGAGQTMADGNPMFHASHGNVAASGAVITLTSLSAARLALRTQRGLQGELYSITPWALVVPPAVETTAEQILATINAATVEDVNPFSEKLELIVEPGLSSATAWYLIGNPALNDGLAHAVLDGMTAPRVESRPAWETIGIQMRLIWALDAKFIETASWYRNPGA